jgi:hypothetical protein
VWRNDDGSDMGCAASIARSRCPSELFDEDWTADETLVTTVLTEQGGKTMVTLTVHCSPSEACDAALRTGMEQASRQATTGLRRSWRRNGLRGMPLRRRRSNET